MPIEFHRDGPWDLPEGWVWVGLRHLVILRGEKASPDRNSPFPFIGMDDVPSNSLRIETRGAFKAMKTAGNKFYPGDLLYGRLRPYLNKAVVADFEGVASGEFIVMQAREGIDVRYLQLWMHARKFVNDATRDTSGDRPRIDFDKIADLDIALPPTAEQRRIVARIDELFSEIADGETALTSARNDLETWRRALLKAAISGELTREWREHHKSNETGADYVQRLRLARGTVVDPEHADENTAGEFPPEWAITRIGDIFEVGTGATPLRGERKYYEGGTIPWVTSSAVNSAIVTESSERITEAAIRETNCKVFPAGTLLVAMYGEGKTRGRATVLGIAAATNQACAALQFPIESEPLRRWIRYWLEFNYLMLRKQAAGGVQPNLNMSLIRNLRVPIPPITEQIEVVQILDGSFDGSSETATTLKQLTTVSSATRQSILKAAFEGRLVEQDEHEEPADVALVRLNARALQSGLASSRRLRRARNLRAGAET